LSEVVVDASVVVKWFVEEEWSREARMLKDDYAAGEVDLIAPALMPFEVLNALRYSSAFGGEELIQVAHILDDLQIALYGLEGDYAEKTIMLALGKGITVYDAAYVALAEIRKALLYTADEKLLRKLRGVEWVAHIRDYPVQH